jgi:hypothetical protein
MPTKRSIYAALIAVATCGLLAAAPSVASADTGYSDGDTFASFGACTTAAHAVQADGDTASCAQVAGGVGTWEITITPRVGTPGGAQGDPLSAFLRGFAASLSG